MTPALLSPLCVAPDAGGQDVGPIDPLCSVNQGKSGRIRNQLTSKQWPQMAVLEYLHDAGSQVCSEDVKRRR